jgi:alpha-beta hydrolase superfamily lysophospholipase
MPAQKSNQAKLRIGPLGLISFLFLFSCHTLPEDPTTANRAQLFFNTPRLSAEKPDGGLTMSSPILQEYSAHFAFEEYLPDDFDYQHYLGKIEWKKDEYVGVNFFQISEPRGHMVLFHGFLGSQALWRNTLGRFLVQGYNLVMVDLPGHGFATGIRGAIDDFDDYGLLINAALDWYLARVPEAKALILGGHSTGATGIIQYLKKPMHPIAGIFMVNPLLHHVYWDVGQIAAFFLQGLAPYHRPLFTPDAYLGPTFFPASWPVRLGEWNSRLPKSIPLGIPLYIHQGENDEVVDFKHNLPRLQKLFPQAQIQLRPELGHTSLLEDKRSQVILDDIQTFLDSLEVQD